MIRDAKIADFPAILGLNLEMEQYLSPLNEKLLSNLHAVAVYHRVIETKQGEVAGFLLALREGADYPSVNYRWFAERYRHYYSVCGPDCGRRCPAGETTGSVAIRGLIRLCPGDAHCGHSLRI